MSGGAFEYKQYKIQDLIEDMENLLVRLDKEPIDSFECNSLKNYIDDKDSFKKIVQKNIDLLKKSYLYTQRIDWFISGDDGEETFYERLEEEIEKLEYEEITKKTPEELDISLEFTSKLLNNSKSLDSDIAKLVNEWKKIALNQKLIFL